MAWRDESEVPSAVLSASEHGAPVVESGRLLHAPPELVWNACTEERHLVRWLPDEGVAGVAPRMAAPGAVPLTERHQLLRLEETEDGRTILGVSMAFRSEMERDEAVQLGVVDALEEGLTRLADYLASLGWGPEDEL